MALELLRYGAYCKRKRRLVRAHHGGARRREHVRGRGAAIVGTSGDLPSAASEKGRTKVPKPRGNSVRARDDSLSRAQARARLPGLAALLQAVVLQDASDTRHAESHAPPHR